MSAQPGRSLILYLYDGVSEFDPIAGARSHTITINNETSVDITNKDSAGVRQLLAGAGVVSLDISCEGVYFDDAIIDEIRTLAQSESSNQQQFRVIVPGATANGALTGTFAVTSLEYSGEYNGEMTYSLSLQSAGAVTFV